VKLLVSALEHSANIHLKELCRQMGGDVELSGIFDASLGEPVADLRSLAVMGFVDAIRKAPFFFGLAGQMTELAAEADKVLLMDSSAFNLPLAGKIRKRFPEKEIVYYVLPQAWAWRKGRIPALARTCDRLLSILPFEPGHYPEHAPIEYVGHPLLDEIRRFKAPDTISRPPALMRQSIAYLPGSRRGEIRQLMPLFHRVREALPPHRARIVIPPYFTSGQIRELYGDLDEFEITHDTHSTLYESDFAFICSGTATLEAALIGTPFVLGYRAKALDAFLVRSLTDLRHAGLANIFSMDFQGRPMHEELLQERLTTENLIRSYHFFDYGRYAEDVQKLREYLRHGSSERVAEILESKSGRRN
jgi:lipid-A-disaccharide synthase